MAILWAPGAAASWGAAMTIAKPIVCSMDPLTFLLTCWAMALVPAFAYGLLVHRLAFPGWTAIGFVTLASLLNVIIGWPIYVVANQSAPAYQSATLASIAPLWGVVGAIFLVHRRATARRSSPRHWPSSRGSSETVPTKLALQHGITSETLLVSLGSCTLVGMSLLPPLLRGRIHRRVPRLVLLAAGRRASWPRRAVRRCCSRSRSRSCSSASGRRVGRCSAYSWCLEV